MANARLGEFRARGGEAVPHIKGLRVGTRVERDALATQIKTALGAAAFAGQALNEQQAKAWIDQAQSLLDRAAALKAG